MVSVDFCYRLYYLVTGDLSVAALKIASYVHHLVGNLLGNVLNFFGAGSNTVQLSIQWHLLNCADKVDSVQRNIQNEIDSVVGHERPPCWEDHNKMHFTMATIWEMYRWRTVAPLSIPRE